MTTTEKAYLGGLVVLVISIWVMGIWGGWAEKAYEKEKESYWAWYWLYFLGIPRSKENCVRFVKITCGLGLTLTLLGLSLVALHEWSR